LRDRNSTMAILGFSLLSSYLLSFLFEGQVLYRLLSHYNIEGKSHIFIAILAHLLGLIIGGYIIKDSSKAKYGLALSGGISLLGSLVFFFPPSIFWYLGLIVSGQAIGYGVASWGYFLRDYIGRDYRIRACAEVLICSNVFMLLINTLGASLRPNYGLLLSLSALLLGVVLIAMLPHDLTGVSEKEVERETSSIFRQTLSSLYLFIFILTINSGLMYQVVTPAFSKFHRLINIFWALPYIFAIALIGKLYKKFNYSNILYLGIGMTITSFISFMILGRGMYDYLIINTLMMGSLGLFDMFWWGVLGEILDYSKNPARVFGIGLSANVLGILVGDIIGILISKEELSNSETTVIAMTVISLSLIILPLLNKYLSALLKNHVFLSRYGKKDMSEQDSIIRQTKAPYPLTKREEEVLQLILLGKSNREIGADLYITENTVKTHVRNIFSKYEVNSRAELISIFLSSEKNISSI